ncbi:MAG: mismatch-specific DNA-glycosylase [Nocardioidaceae bacterium]
MTVERVPRHVLPDILAPHLSVLFCGTAVPCAAARGHYHAGPGDDFWRFLHEAGFTPRRLAPSDDAMLATHGHGLTDLAKRPLSPGGVPGYDVARLVRTVEACQPRWLAFTSKTAGQAAARGLGHPVPGLGPADWQVGGADVYVLPSPSGANRRRDYDGRPSRVDWWSELCRLVQEADLRTA